MSSPSRIPGTISLANQRAQINPFWRLDETKCKYGRHGRKLRSVAILRTCQSGYIGFESHVQEDKEIYYKKAIVGMHSQVTLILERFGSAEVVQKADITVKVNETVFKGNIKCKHSMLSDEVCSEGRSTEIYIKSIINHSKSFSSMVCSKNK